MASLALLVLASALCRASAVSDRYLIWPPAKSITSSGRPLALSPALSVEFEGASAARASPRLQKAVARFSSRLGRMRERSPSAIGAAPAGPALSAVSLLVRSGDESLNDRTDYSYSLVVDPAANASLARVESHSISGAIYALASTARLRARAPSTRARAPCPRMRLL